MQKGASHTTYEQAQKHSVTLLRLLSLIGLLSIVAFSMIPGGFQIRTGLPKEIEHFLAYFAVAAIIAAWRRSPRQAAVAVLALTFLAGAMEVVQEFIPGRNGSWRDIFASALGAIGGAAAGLLADIHGWPRRLRRRWRAGRRRMSIAVRRRG
jgi:hypothetical protein